MNQYGFGEGAPAIIPVMLCSPEVMANARRALSTLNKISFPQENSKLLVFDVQKDITAWLIRKRAVNERWKNELTDLEMEGLEYLAQCCRNDRVFLVEHQGGLAP